MLLRVGEWGIGGKVSDGGGNGGEMHKIAHRKSVRFDAEFRFRIGPLPHTVGVHQSTEGESICKRSSTDHREQHIVNSHCDKN